jgi:long-chain acyl-CoA synthetase
MTSQKHAASKWPQQNVGSGTSEADTFSKLLLRHQVQRGSRPAIREKKRGIWHTTTWHELAEEAAALAAALADRGLGRGAHVALLGDNRPRLYAAMSAAHALGAIAVPLYQDASAEELVPLLAAVGATYVFAENQEQVDKLLSVLPKLPGVRTIVYDADRGMRHYRQPQLSSYAALLQEGRDILAKAPGFLAAQTGQGSGADAAFVFFTSGSTGPAKPVVLTHGALIERARAMAAIEGFRDEDVALAYLPPGWVAQNLFSYVLPMVVGSCVCCPESSETMVSDMREIGPSVFLASPRVLDALLTQITTRIEDASGLSRGLYRFFMRGAEKAVRRQLSGKGGGGGFLRLLGNPLIYAPIRDIFGLSRVRVAYTTGDAIDPDLIVFFRALGINLKQLYGSTEAAFLIALHRDGDVRLDTVGTAIEGVQVRVSDNREILVRSAGLFSEYRGDAKATSEVRTGDGWMRTGDAGYVSSDGHIRIVDSLSNVGKLKGGSLFAPRAIENKLKFFPYIKEAVALGDGRDTVCALIDIDTLAVSRWADKRSISYTGNADLASRDEVYELVANCIANLNRDLANDAEFSESQIARFVILPKEMSPDDGVLTRTGKPQRAAIAKKYKVLVDAMYAGKDSAPFDVDGAGPTDDVLKIRDAATSAPAKTRRAA